MKTKTLTTRYSWVTIATLTMTSSTLLAATAKVTSSGDSGDGTFRAAVEEANSDESISSIQFSPGVGTVALQSSVTYTGGQKLTINGRGVVIEPEAGGIFDLFVGDGGGDIRLEVMTLQNSGGAGVFIDVPDDATGTMAVSLLQVTLADNGLEGLLIDDCDGPDLDTCGGSDAGVDLTVSSSTISGNGRSPGVSDVDAIRINERGGGDVSVSIQNSSIDSNGGDGLEVEEGHAGTVHLIARNSTLNDNGDQDPDDLEDGIDIDERGEGDVVVNFVNVVVRDCYDEAIDLNEDDEGDIDARFIRVQALGAKGGDGIRCREDGDGSIVVVATQTSAIGNDDEGIQLEEQGEGDLVVQLQEVASIDNDDHGIQMEESDGGSLGAQLNDLIVDNNNDDGLQMEEADEGDLLAEVADSAITNNDNYGIKAEQGDDGIGHLSLTNVDLSNNGDGELDVDGVVVTE